MGSAVSLKRTVNTLSCCGDIPITRQERYLLRLWEARKDFGNGRVVYAMGGGTFCEHFSDMDYREFCDFHQVYQESRENNEEFSRSHVASSDPLMLPPFGSASSWPKSSERLRSETGEVAHDFRTDYGAPDGFMNAEELSTANQTPDLPAVGSANGDRPEVHAVGFARPSYETTQEDASVSSWRSEHAELEADQGLGHGQNIQPPRKEGGQLLTMRQVAQVGEWWPEVATLGAPTPGPLDKDYVLPTDIGVIQRGAKDLFNRSAWLSDSDPNFIEDVFDIAGIVGQRVKSRLATVDPTKYVTPETLQRILLAPGLGPRVASWGSRISTRSD